MPPRTIRCDFATRWGVLSCVRRHRQLNRMVHQITGDHGLLAFRVDVHADVIGCVAGRRQQADFLADLVVVSDVVDQPRGHDRIN